MFAKIKRFVAPPVFPEDEEKTSTAQLLNVILITIFGVAVALVGSLSLVDSLTPIIKVIGIVIAVFTLLIWLVMRQGYIKLASVLLASLLLLGTTAILYLVGSIRDPIAPTLLLSVMIATLFVSSQAGVIFAGLSILIIVVLYQLESAGRLAPFNYALEPEHWVAFVGIVTIATTLLLLTNRSRNNILHRIRFSNQELQLLTEKIQTRAQGMAVMIEVSRDLTQVRNLEALLKEASELIYKRFNLYHVQIYLADKNQAALSLKAGTGQIGMQLVQQDHGLPFGSGSINGIAAAEKRAVIVQDTAVSPLFKPNTLLPNTRSEMAVPLMLGDAVLGVLDLQSDTVNGLNVETLPAFEMLAAQIAIAIENARLFTETTQARSEIESYLQLMTRQKFADYFDAIQRPEKLGYSYDAVGEVVVPGMTSTTSPDQNMMQVPIVWGNEVVGTIELEADDDRFWTSETLDLVTAVAQQVGQQAENLRLFGEVEHSRFKAEQASRRLTREGWQNYQEHLALPGFVYDGTEVKPLAAGQEEGDSDETVNLPLQVRGQAIGQLVLAGVNNVDEETQVLLTAVAQQLSDHIETLRLTQQTEQALAGTEALYQGSDRIVRADTLAGVLKSLVDSTYLRKFNRHSIVLFEPQGAAQPQSVFIAAHQRNDGQPPQMPVGTRFELAQYSAVNWISRDEPTLIKDIIGDERIDDNFKAILDVLKTRAVAIFPLVTGGHWFGVILAQSDTPTSWEGKQVRQTASLVDQAATVIQTMRLLQITQQRAERETLVNSISQKIQRSVTMESALETAVHELGLALQTRYTTVKLTTTPEKEPNGMAGT